MVETLLRHKFAVEVLSVHSPLSLVACLAVEAVQKIKTSIHIKDTKQMTKNLIYFFFNKFTNQTFYYANHDDVQIDC